MVKSHGNFALTQRRKEKKKDAKVNREEFPQKFLGILSCALVSPLRLCVEKKEIRS
jgi:hypothetical protein